MLFRSVVRQGTEVREDSPNSRFPKMEAAASSPSPEQPLLAPPHSASNYHLMPSEPSSTNSSAAREPPSPYRLTPEQILLSEQRKAKKAEKVRLAAETAALVSETNATGLSLGRDAALAKLGERGKIIGRRWAGVTPTGEGEYGYKVKVMSWNVRRAFLCDRTRFWLTNGLL